MSELRRRLIWRTVIAVGLGGAGLAGLLAAIVGLTDAAQGMAEASPKLLAAGVGAFSVGTALAGLRFRSLLPTEGPKVPARVLVQLFFAANALNIVLPGPAGDLALAAVLDRRHGLPVETGIAVGLHARLVGLLVTGLLAVGVALALPTSAVVGQAVTLGVLALGVVGTLAAGVAFRPRPLARVSAAMAQQWSSWNKVHARVERVVWALEAVSAQGWRAMLAAAGWSLLIQGFMFCTLVATCAAAGMTVPLSGLLLTHAAAGVAAVGAVILPAGGAGGYELAFVTVLSASSPLSVAAASAVVVLVRMVQLSCIGLSSAVLLAMVPEMLVEPSERMQPGTNV